MFKIYIVAYDFIYKICLNNVSITKLVTEIKPIFQVHPSLVKILSVHFFVVFIEKIKIKRKDQTNVVVYSFIYKIGRKLVLITQSIIKIIAIFEVHSRTMTFFNHLIVVTPINNKI